MGKDGKPRGKMTAYAYFVQVSREEFKKKNPGEQVSFTDFSKKCGERWKTLAAKDKKRFEDMAAKDKVRHETEMANYDPPEDGETSGKGRKSAGGKRKRVKDPNAPKRALSAYFMFCNEERGKVKAKLPADARVADIAKELGKRWETCPNKEKFAAMAAKDKQRYETAMAAYVKSGGGPSAGNASKKARVEPPKKKAAPQPVSDEDDDDDDDANGIDDEDEDDEDDESD